MLVKKMTIFFFFLCCVVVVVVVVVLYSVNLLGNGDLSMRVET